MKWRRLVGEIFAPLFGGTREAWSEANRVFTGHLFEPERWEARLQAASDYADFERRYFLDWLSGMCEVVGVAAPPEEECIALARRANARITSQASAPFPGVVEAIRALYEQGYTLHTASGEPSYDLESYLVSMGVRDCFARLYGPNLIDAFKNGPEYYERLLADCGVAPADALFVDDSPQVVGWAAQVGARAILISTQPPQQHAAAFCLNSLAELPELLRG